MRYEYNPSDLRDFIHGYEHRQKGDELEFKYCPFCLGGSHQDKYTCAVNVNTGMFKCLRASCGKQGHFAQMAIEFNYPLFKQQSNYKIFPKRNLPKPVNRIYDYMAKRGISKETVDKYKLFQDKDNAKNLCFPFYDENNILQLVKFRNMEFDKTKDKAKEWSVKDCKPILFGMAQCEDFDTLTFTEGQCDSLSLAECGIKNAVSVPTGAMGFTWVQHCFDWVMKFKKIIVFGDMENGRMSLVDRLRNTFNLPVYAVQEKHYIGEKDANDILINYGKQAIIDAVENAQLQDVDYVLRMSDLPAKYRDEMPRIDTGIYEVDKAINGISMGQIVILSGRSGEGKTTLLSQMIADAVEQNNGVFMYSGEMLAQDIQEMINLQIAGDENATLCKNRFDEEYYRVPKNKAEIIKRWYHDKLFIMDNDAIGKPDFKGILQTAETAIKRYGLSMIVIDNLLTVLDDDINTDLFRQQSKFIREFKAMCEKYMIVGILVAHPKKFNGEFQNDYLSGTSDIHKLSDIIMFYERYEADDNLCDALLWLTKNRLGGKYLKGNQAVKMFYDAKSKRVMSRATKKKVYSCFKPEWQEITDDDCPFLL